MIGKIEKKKRIGKIGSLVVVGMFVLIGLAMPVAGDTCDVWVRDDVNTCIYPENIGDELGIGDTSPDFKLEVTGSSGSGYFGVTSSSDGDLFKIDSSGNTIFNDGSGDYDFRIEGNGDANMFFVDASNDRIGIGTTTPSAKLDIETDQYEGGAATIGNSNCVASGDYAVAMGDETTASGEASFAVGWDSDATGRYSIAMGSGFNLASGDGALVLGAFSTASGTVSTAIGWHAEASGFTSTAIGSFLRAGPSSYTHVIGVGWSNDYRIVNNIGYSLMVGYNSDEPTLFVGPSSGPGTTGKIGIATTDPTAKVHIVQTSLTDDAFRVDDDLNENTPFVIDKDGNVGIGTGSPTGVLDVNGNDIRIHTSQTPASCSAAGYAGEIAWGSSGGVSYIYVCVSGDGPGGFGDNWGRVALTTSGW